jgi:RimJ/RimL family protein N-acetyltransferase
MVGFDAWKPNSCQAHIAMDSRMVGIALARAAFPFVFEFGGRGLILGTVAASNAASIGLALRLGFTMTHAVQDGWAPGVDLVGLELRKENCRWLRSHTGKRKAA